MPGFSLTKLSHVLALLLVLTLRTQPARADAVDDYLGRVARQQDFPGLAVGVIRDGKILKARGYGVASLEHHVSVTPATVFDLASLTKPFVSEAVLLLLQEGKLSLDDSLSKHVSGVPAAWSAVTLRHLLTHTSGIPDYLNELGRNFPHHTTAGEFLKAIAGEALAFKPGEKWAYSNTGYVLLGMVVAQVAGEPYDEFLARRVFRPLGMDDTRLDSVDAVILNRATGYVSSHEGLRNGTFLKHLMMNHGDRGLISSVLDLVKWDGSLDGNRLLTDETRRLMWTPVRLNNGKTFGYGLGWFIGEADGRPFVRHPGGSPGTATVFTRFPADGLTVILLANRGQAALHGADLGVARHYLPALRRAVVPVSAGDLTAAAGYYNIFGGQILRVVGGAHFLELDGAGFGGRFVPLATNRFAAEGPDHELLVTSAAGRVTGGTMKFAQESTALVRLGPLVRDLPTQSDPDPALTLRLGDALAALGRGLQSGDNLTAVSPQTRSDFGQGPVGEVSGVQAIRFLASLPLPAGAVRRHDTAVSRVIYAEGTTGNGPRRLLLSLDSEGRLADVDVLSD
jgi:CubicO group peptidase (beta-lactamase class C family)